jgi:hypothetical protein
VILGIGRGGGFGEEIFGGGGMVGIQASPVVSGIPSSTTISISPIDLDMVRTLQGARQVQIDVSNLAAQRNHNLGDAWKDVLRAVAGTGLHPEQLGLDFLNLRAGTLKNEAQSDSLGFENKPRAVLGTDNESTIGSILKKERGNGRPSTAQSQNLNALSPIHDDDRVAAAVNVENQNPLKQLTAKVDNGREQPLHLSESESKSVTVDTDPLLTEGKKFFDLSTVEKVRGKDLQLAVLERLRDLGQASRQPQGKMEPPSTSSTSFVKPTLKEQTINLGAPEIASNNIVRFVGPNPRLDLANQPGTAGSISLVKDPLAERQLDLIPA